MGKIGTLLPRTLFIIVAAALTSFLILYAEDKKREAQPVVYREPVETSDTWDGEYESFIYNEELGEVLIGMRAFSFLSEKYTINYTKNESGFSYTVEFDAPGDKEGYFSDGGGAVSAIGFDGKTLRFFASELLAVEVSFGERQVAVSSVPLRERYGMIVYIDPGHGGNDPGKGKDGILEKDINLNIALMLRDMINQEDLGIYPYLSRETDVAVNRYDRAAEASSLADILVSIHCNSFTQSGINGTEVYYNPLQVLKPDIRSGLTSLDLARIMQRNVCEAAGSNNRGIRDTGTLVVVSVSTVPSVLVEAGYMTNPAELALLVTEEYQRKLAEGIYNGILEAYGLK